MRLKKNSIIADITFIQILNNTYVQKKWIQIKASAPNVDTLT